MSTPKNMHEELMRLADSFATTRPGGLAVARRDALEAYARTLTDRITELEAQLEAVGAGGVVAILPTSQQLAAGAFYPQVSGFASAQPAPAVGGQPYLRDRLKDFTCTKVDNAGGTPGLTIYKTKLGAHPEFQLYAVEATALWMNIGRSLGLNPASQPHHFAEPAPAVVGPDWYHAECDDPDRSGFYLAKSDAQTQVNDHGGYVTELFAGPLPHQIAAAAVVGPDGWQLVPKNAIPEMEASAYKNAGHYGAGPAADYAAMLAAAPKPHQIAEPASDISDKQVDAYLKAQRETVEKADREFGRPNVGGLHTNTVREACRNGLRTALAAAPAITPKEPS